MPAVSPESLSYAITDNGIGLEECSDAFNGTAQSNRENAVDFS